MPRPAPVVPPYRHFKTRNLAFTIVGKRKIYLGRYGSAESREQHARIVREALAAAPSAAGPTLATPKVDPHAITVAAVMAAFWEHAKRRYAYDPKFEGKRPPGEIGLYWDVMRPVLKLFGSTPAAEFGPRALSLVQDELIAMDWCKNVINRATTRIRSIFKWASGPGELLPADVQIRLKSLPGLREGERKARSTEDVVPVPTDVLDATLAHCSPRLKAMVQIHALTGMRSSEMLSMRTADVEQDGAVWTYRPRTHKNKHRGHKKAVHLGPLCQSAIKPYLKPEDPEAFIFSPAEEMAEVRAARAAARTTPISCGNKAGTNVQASPVKVPGKRYSANSYNRAIKRACDKADTAARKARVEAGKRDDGKRLVAPWHAHQIRHRKGKAVRAKHGTDGVLATLGQRTSAMADRYAEIEEELAKRIAAEMG